MRAGTALATQERAELLAVVAEPIRLAVLQALDAGTACVCDLQARVPVAASLLSYHLRVLREAGLIRSERRGRRVDYSLVEPALTGLHAALPGPPCSPPPAPPSSRPSSAPSCSDTCVSTIDPAS